MGKLREEEKKKDEDEDEERKTRKSPDAQDINF